MVIVVGLGAAIVVGLLDQRRFATAKTMLRVSALPLGPLALTGCLALLFPCRSRSLRWKWQRRSRRGQQLRWLILTAAACVVMPVLLAADRLPSLIIWHAIGGGADLQIAPTPMLSMLVLACVCSAAMYGLGLKIADLLCLKRRRRLLDCLANAEGG